MVDGHPIDFGGNEPFIADGYTLAPVGPLFEALHIRPEPTESVAEFSHLLTGDPEEDELAVAGSSLGLLAIFHPDSYYVEINGILLEMYTETRLIGNELYIPVRVLGESAGYDVEWDAGTRTVVLERRQGAKGFLWEVRNGEKSVYLLGSIHAANPSFYPLDPAIEEAFYDAEHIGFEIDSRKGETPEVAALIEDMSKYQDGTTLKDHISAETYQLLTEYLATLGLPENVFDEYKPWAVYTSLASVQYQQAGIHSAFGIEQYVLGSAVIRQIPIFELESFESQLGMFDEFSAELQEALLLDVLNPGGESIEELHALIDSWKSGDIDLLTRTVEEMETLRGGEYYEGMLKDRNVKMAEKIKEILAGDEDEDYLVIVGAAHMPGKDGIVTLLEEAGYTVDRK